MRGYAQFKQQSEWQNTPAGDKSTNHLVFSQGGTRSWTLFGFISRNRPISRECAKPCDSRAWRFSSRRKRACWLKSRACSYLERAAAVAVRWPVGRAWGLGVVSRRRPASHTRTHTVCVEKRKKNWWTNVFRSRNNTVKSSARAGMFQ